MFDVCALRIIVGREWKGVTEIAESCVRNVRKLELVARCVVGEDLGFLNQIICSDD